MCTTAHIAARTMQNGVIATHGRGRLRSQQRLPPAPDELSIEP